MQVLFRSAFILFFFAATACAQTAPDYREPQRPQFHFTPAKNWTNDPNGLVFFKGEYHLFYQYNPFGDTWGHMSWGHAVSNDMLHWKHLPVALPEADGIMMFSGSAVVDWNNTSGFGKGGEPPLIAVYTGHTATHQHQSIAYSTDRGRTWTKYSGNPVIPSKRRHFRDPKVFWHEESGQWIMLTVLADERKVRFFGSKNLKDWTRLSDFGPSGAFPVSNWECPDLFELPVENAPGESKWVLQVDSGNGHPAGGSGCQYFVGGFDGRRFRSDNPPESALWVDYGKDFYAGQSWSDVPAADGRRLILGWMNNWRYARLIPTNPWRGAMTLPREVSLRRYPEGIRLRQAPLREARKLRGEHLSLRDVSVEEAASKIRERNFDADTLEIEVEIELGGAAEAGLSVRGNGQGQRTLIGYSPALGHLFVDRAASGATDFHDDFSGRHAARLAAPEGKVKLHVFVDRSSVEVFGGDGRATITERIFPDPPSQGWSPYANGGAARVARLDAWKLRSVWPRR